MKPMSHSTYRKYMVCAAAAKAEADGLYSPVVVEAWLVGSYIDRALTSADKFEDWVKQHAEAVFQKDGKKKRAAFASADAAIARVKADPVWKELATAGAFQVEVAGVIGSVPWRGILDWAGMLGGAWCVLDLKKTASFADVWAMVENNRRLPVPWYDAKGYWRSMAVYRELFRQSFPERVTEPAKGLPVMAGVGLPHIGILGVTTPSDGTPNMGLWMMTGDDAPARFSRELRTIEGNLPSVLAWRDGSEAAPGCGECEWCASQSNFGVTRTAKSGRVTTLGV